MRRLNPSSIPSTNSKDYGNTNLKDLANGDACNQPSRLGSLFSGFQMGAMTLEDELVDNNKKSRPTNTLRNPSGRIMSEQGVAHEVISNDVQWKKFQAEMKEKGAVSGMMLKQNLHGLLKDRAKELPSQPRRASDSGAVRRTSYITSFATSLILGEGDQSAQGRRMSMPTQSTASVLDNPRSQISALFGDAALDDNSEEPFMNRRPSNDGPGFAPVTDVSRPVTQFDKPMRWNRRGSTASSVASEVIFEGNHSDEDFDENDDDPMASSERMPRRGTGDSALSGRTSKSAPNDMNDPGQTDGDMKRKGQSRA